MALNSLLKPLSRPVPMVTNGSPASTARVKPDTPIALQISSQVLIERLNRTQTWVQVVRQIVLRPHLRQAASDTAATRINDRRVAVSGKTGDQRAAATISRVPAVTTTSHLHRLRSAAPHRAQMASP